jgi:hypothetical protein
LTVPQAPLVDQLSRMPEAISLVRDYLLLLGIPHRSGAQRARTPPA